MRFVLRVAMTASAVALAMSTIGGGLASADPLTGKKYSDAVAQVAKMNGTPVVATVNGSQQAQDDCIVISWSKSIFLDSSGDKQDGNNYLLNLNCNLRLAGPGHPGNSLMTPQGRQEKKDEVFAAKVAKNPSLCERTESAAKHCARVCESTGLCEAPGT